MRLPNSVERSRTLLTTEKREQSRWVGNPAVYRGVFAWHVVLVYEQSRWVGNPAVYRGVFPWHVVLVSEHSRGVRNPTVHWGVFTRQVALVYVSFLCVRRVFVF